MDGGESRSSAPRSEKRAVAALERLEPRAAAAGAELGLERLRLEYRGEPVTADALAARVERDLERGTTGLGPHLDEIAVLAGTRELRLYGSQGEQRVAVLALVLGEAALLSEEAGVAPLLLLDDVLSELDPGRRDALARLLRGQGQTLVTATDASFLPGEPDLLLSVSPGEVTRA